MQENKQTQECKDYVSRQRQLMTHHAKARDAILVKKLSEDAIVPTKANRSDAGWDLYSLSDASLDPGTRALIKTGISLEIPSGYVGLIWPRSGLAVKNGIDVFAGVVDAGYRGDVGVCLHNSSEQKVEIKQGDRIAQILFQPVPHFRLVESSDLTSTERGEGGFGSSGK